MLVLACYDVSGNRRRRRLTRLLEGTGRRVQRSVFLCHLDAEQIQDLCEAGRRMLDPDEDVLSFYPLCRRCARQARHVGTPANAPEAPPACDVV